MREWGVVLTVVLIAVAWAGPARAQSGDPLPMLLEDASLVDDLEAAREAILNLRFQEAERLLQQIAFDGGAAAAEHHRATIALLRALFADDPDHLAAFYEHSDRLKQLLSNAGASPWRTYLDGENDFQRAVAYAKEGRNVRAALAARSAHQSLDGLVRQDPSFGDAYKSLGVIKMAIGTLPGRYQSILGVLGFRGSVEEGLDMLRTAAAESRFNRPEATMYLAVMLSQVERSSDEPVRLLDELAAERQSSPLIGYVHGYMLLHHRQAARAEQSLRRAADDASAWYIDFTDYYLGHAILVQDRFDEAESYFRSYLARNDDEVLRAQTLLGLGLSAEMQGDRRQALEWYRQVSGDRGQDPDLAAAMEAAQRLEAPIVGRARDLLLARNAFDSGRYDRAVQLLSALLNESDLTPAERAEAAYRLGRVCHATGREEDALAWYAQGALNSEFVGGRWAPWGHFFRGEILADRGQVERARTEFRRASSFSHEYDYQSALQSSIRAALEQLDSR